MVTRIICASVSTVRGSVMDELFRIRDHICAHGEGTSVMGALLFSAGWFLLWLEGPDDDVEAARKRAARDRRNMHQRVIHRSVGPATLTTMATVVMAQMAESPAGFWHRIVRVRDGLGPALDPAGIWHALSAPCVAPPGAGMDDCPRRHVALVSAEDNGPIHLLRNLSDRCGTTLVYQRIADSACRGSDVGVAYADIPTHSGIVRVQLLSRRALSKELVRASIDGAESLVLLLGSRDALAQELAGRVAECTCESGRHPRFILCGDDREIVARASDQLRAAGGRECARLDPSQLEAFIVGQSAARPRHRHEYGACDA
ncbi:MAG TPA: BLUF domain-containing protein [Ramlibacter sp.]|uniref:BLUF domain-containing protein n=1 Tax=Ramlibacter sp. TaxID=1917967 RepID=UPI002C6CE49A|nr:BLUF domain-containing protein [Ramlibacter sp.]HVZ46052.1 BLUF domain-containing protein [Ramlibacter sp.]